MVDGGEDGGNKKSSKDVCWRRKVRENILGLFFFFLIFIYLFIYFWLCWVFISV